MDRGGAQFWLDDSPFKPVKHQPYKCSLGISSLYIWIKRITLVFNLPSFQSDMKSPKKSQRSGITVMWMYCCKTQSAKKVRQVVIKSTVGNPESKSYLECFMSFPAPQFVRLFVCLLACFVVCQHLRNNNFWLDFRELGRWMSREMLHMIQFAVYLNHRWHLSAPHASFVVYNDLKNTIMNTCGCFWSIKSRG